MESSIRHGTGAITACWWFHWQGSPKVQGIQRSRVFDEALWQQQDSRHNLLALRNRGKMLSCNGAPGVLKLRGVLSLLIVSVDKRISRQDQDDKSTGEDGQASPESLVTRQLRRSYWKKFWPYLMTDSQ